MSPRAPISPRTTKISEFSSLRRRSGRDGGHCSTVERIRKLVRAALRRPTDTEGDEGLARTHSPNETSANEQRRPVIQYIRTDDAATD